MRIFAIGLIGLAAVLATSKKPEGVEIQGHTVKLKAGYAFHRASSNKVYSYSIAGPGRNQISGTYKCDCDKGSGSCNADLTKTTLTCTPAGSCTGCQLTVTIGKDGKLGMLRPGGDGGL
ncbi:MAG TPA: hypothetical protein VF975_04915 [Thermoanaerobaculia bacterium]